MPKQTLQQKIRRALGRFTAKRIAMILLGTAILSFGIHNIHQRTAITEGGVIGLVLLINHWLGVPASVASPLLDAASYALAFKFLGWDFLLSAGLASVSLAGFYRIWECLPPMLPDLTPWPLAAALLGGVFDKVFTSPETLTVQKLGVLYDAHPALALPDWASYTTLTIETDIGSIVFAGSASQYEDFLFPANGDYKAKLTVWRLPQDYLATQFEGGSTGAIRKNLGVEHPAKPTGWYSYSFRFTLQASAEVTLSTERLEQGGVAALSITGLTGETAPAVETDLGSVQCVRLGSGWRAYIPAAYNASAGGHTVNVTVNGETFARTLTVLPKDFGTVEVEPEPASTEAANAEFRNNIWPLYEQPVREKLWAGAFLCPAENYMTLVDFGQVKVTGGQQGSRSNSTRLYTIPGEPCRAPAGGVVVFAGNLALTGNTVVIDHGCGVRSYLYGLQELSVTRGQTVERGQAVGVLGEELTMDFKLGSKSVNPWPLFQTSGGLFWQEKG